MTDNNALKGLFSASTAAHILPVFSFCLPFTAEETLRTLKFLFK